MKPHYRLHCALNHAGMWWCVLRVRPRATLAQNTPFWDRTPKEAMKTARVNKL